MPSEQEYIQKILELQAEIDQDNELIEAAYNKIKELELKVALSNSSHSKKVVSDKQIKSYESRIAELESCVNLVTEDMLGVKLDESSNNLKQLIKLRGQLSKLAESKRIRGSDICTLDDALSVIEESESARFIQLINSIITYRNIKGNQELGDIVEEIRGCLPALSHVIVYRESENFKLKQEVNRLNAIINSESDTTKVIKLQKKIEDKTSEVDALKLKIAALEHELKSK